MQIKEIIKENQTAFRVYLGSFINDLLSKNLCNDCRQTIINQYKEVINNPESVH